MNIGEVIKNIRENQNISMNQLAKIADISQSSLSRIEAGLSQPTFDVLERIIIALDFSLAEFFSNEQQTVVDPSIVRLVQAAEKLTNEEREHLTKFIQSRKE